MMINMSLANKEWEKEYHIIIKNTHTHTHTHTTHANTYTHISLKTDFISFPFYKILLE